MASLMDGKVWLALRTLPDNPTPEDSPYNYFPIKYVATIFLVLYSISTLVHVGQSIYFRMWWLLPTAVLCGFLEILGWSGRLWSSISPFLDSPFQMQITATILGPTPLLAANFVILGLFIKYLGTAYSRLSPKLHAIIFCTCDVVSLVVQGVGGGLAASADTDEGARRGGNIMLGGIAFQLVTISVFAICGTEFFIRYLKDRPLQSAMISGESPVRRKMDSRMKIMSIALVFITICLFIRAIYRTIELSDGWNGRIISTQIYFNILDGAMVILAIYTLNFAHPGYLLPSKVTTTFNGANDGYKNGVAEHHHDTTA